MSKTVIEVENLSKRYRIGASEIEPQGIGGLLRDITTAPIRNLKRLRNLTRFDEEDSSDVIWALKDISFSVEQGEIIGIIGRNGSGKSTLLKILSRITDPTSGKARLTGRVGALLEVGTGFHPEMTGRENIFFSGTLLGMSRAEIARKFDRIVAFSGVETFLDTPVKRYSSGMYVRLAFSVAAHLEPEILIVDEVLAVGDAAFQKKCVGQMDSVAGKGNTVLVVSHNMAVIDSLCTRAILLDSGRIKSIGKTAKVIAEYIQSNLDNNSIQVNLREHQNRQEGMKPAMTSVTLRNKEGHPAQVFKQGDPIRLEISYDATAYETSLSGIGFNLCTQSDVRIGCFNNYMNSKPPWKLEKKGTVAFIIKEPVLMPGNYNISVSLGIHQSHLLDYVKHAIEFSIMESDIYKTGYILTPEDGVAAFKCDIEQY